MTPGSHNVAAEIVARALLEAGATNLQAKIGTHVASYGDHCWQTDVAIQTIVKRWDGRAYHRESIGRARRRMATAGWIESKRIFPQQVPDGAQYRSTHGTTSKRISWKVLGLRNPLTRGEQRKRRDVQQRVSVARHELERGPVRRPRVVLEPSIIAMVSGIGAPTSPHTTRALKRGELSHPADGAARDDRDTATKAADARRRLEAWRRENPDGERGPP
jgi:hypothetical protein